MCGTAVSNNSNWQRENGWSRWSSSCLWISHWNPSQIFTIEVIHLWSCTRHTGSTSRPWSKEAAAWCSLLWWTADGSWWDVLGGGLLKDACMTPSISARKAPESAARVSCASCPSKLTGLAIPQARHKHLHRTHYRRWLVLIQSCLGE